MSASSGFSGAFNPDSSFELLLSEGDYTYYCRLHPWLTGSITVLPSSVPPTEEPVIDYTEIEYFSINDADDDSVWNILTSCENCEIDIELSDDHKQGLSSILFSIKGNQFTTGPYGEFNYNFEPINFNEYTSLDLWIKTKGSVSDKSIFLLVDSSGIEIPFHTFDSNVYSEWTEITIPIPDLLTSNPNFNSENVTGITLVSPDGDALTFRQMYILLDEIKLIPPALAELSH